MAVAGVSKSGSATEQVAQMFTQLPELVNSDADLVRRGRFLTTEFEIGASNLQLHIAIENGSVRPVLRGPFLLKPWAFVLRADADIWLKFLEPVPAPGVHDLMALSKTGLVRIEGNLQPFMANLQYIKDVVAAPRKLRAAKH